MFTRYGTGTGTGGSGGGVGIGGTGGGIHGSTTPRADAVCGIIVSGVIMGTGIGVGIISAGG